MRPGSTGRRILALALAAASIAALPAYAQKSARMAEGRSPASEFETKLGNRAVEFWNPKLNDYKVRIDKFLTSPDLEEMNRLRVRWALLTHEMQEISRERDARASVSEDPASLHFAIDDNEMANMKEMMDVFAATKTLAEKYRPELDGLTPVVIEHIASFVENMAGDYEEFAGASGAADGTDDGGASVTGRTFREEAAQIRSDEGMKSLHSVYGFGVEPIVMLYNGADLRTLLGQVGASSGVTTGINLPEMSALRQNVPNPASSATNIVYVLNEPSSATMLRIFDARGDLKTTLDQGSRPAGEHEVEVDVSAYPSGSYLYHLTIRTASGDRVYSRTMQVVH